MGRIVVNVMPATDAPETKTRAAEAGFEEFTRVREGKRFLISVEGEPTDAQMERAGELALQLAGEGLELAGVHPEGATVTVGEDDEDEWDVYESGIGAMAPIPDGAGQHTAKTFLQPHAVELDHGVHSYGTGVYSGEDD